jgi:hypothetical protein
VQENIGKKRALTSLQQVYRMPQDDCKRFQKTETVPKGMLLFKPIDIDIPIGLACNAYSKKAEDMKER